MVVAPSTSSNAMSSLAYDSSAMAAVRFRKYALERNPLIRRAEPILTGNYRQRLNKPAAQFASQDYFY